MPGKGERCREIKRQGWGVRDRYRKVMEIEAEIKMDTERGRHRETN